MFTHYPAIDVSRHFLYRDGKDEPRVFPDFIYCRKQKNVLLTDAFIF